MKIDVFAGMLSLEFDGDVVRFKTNDDDNTDNIYVNYLGISSPLYDDCCEFSNVSMQELFLDRKSDDDTLVELNRIKLGKVK